MMGQNQTIRTSRYYSDYNCVGHNMETRSCIFTNICYSPKNHSFLFYYDGATTSLPPETFVGSTGHVSWPEKLMTGDWKVSLDTTYIHEKSQYESVPGEYTFRLDVVMGPTPMNSIWESNPYMFLTRTRHDDNIGHLVFDYYHPVLTAIETHIGLEYARNVTTIDHIWRPHSFSRYNGLYDKWKQKIGSILFAKQFSYREFKEKSKRYLHVRCFERLLVGCGQLAGLQGQVLHRQGSIRFLRQRLWKEYASTRQTGTSALDKINILMLHKNSSNWRLNASQVNVITNWNDIVYAVSALPDVNVVQMAPQVTDFQIQIQNYRNADITISLWGGISMLNFMMEPGGIEILITSWFKNIMPFPANSTSKTLICPDFDDRARMSLDHKSLRFCTRDEGLTPNHIDVGNFMKLVEHAIRYVHWKRVSGSRIVSATGQK